MFRRRRAWLALALLAVAALGFVGFGIVRNGPSGPPHPERWDAAVLPLVRFVEENRGLRFRHPVAIAYLSDVDFRRDVAATGRSSTKEPQTVHDDEAADRALGLPVGKDGLVAADSALSGQEITAFYDDQTERVEVRGSDPTVGRRATLVHELTHALQDQYFDISREGTYASDDRNDAFESVVEGDAVRMENAYVGQLPQAEQDAYDREQDAGDAGDGAGGDQVPDWYAELTDAPYGLGEPFTRVLDAAGGRAAVDRALRNPPRAEAQIIDASRYRRGEETAKVTRPAAPSGDRVIKHTDLGELRWLLLLAERLPAADALRAADGWAGDAYLIYEHRGR
ncbi:MAG: hypothetical protein LC792_13055, partial [Actinobacteria bacterium]|nr:hypothetical protein [Actinomycetota bacterium]